VAARLFALAAVLVIGSVQAQPSLPYTPSVSARHALALLADQADLPLTLTQWPLPAGAVAEALQALPKALSPTLERARDSVQAELRRASAAHVDLRLRPRADTLVGYGDNYAPASSLAFGSAPLGPAPGVPVTGRIGLRVEADPGAPVQRRGGARARLDDSAVVTGALGVNLQAWTRQTWWSPGWRSSLILGNNTPALSGVSLQRASGGVSTSPWLSWLGPWNVEAFVAQQEGDAAPAYGWLVGQRLTLRPWSGWEFGLSRTAQWGGQGRDQSASSFLHMLTGSGTNADTQAQQASDPGNQMAGFDVRARCPAGWNCAAYLQLIGEDQAGIMPSRYLSLYGIETWSADGQRRYTIEYADSACESTPDAKRSTGCAYRNYLYPNGYASAGRWLGASQGPDARLLSFSLFDQPGATRLRMDVGLLSGFAGDAPPLASPASTGVNTHLLSLQAQRSYAWSGGQLTPELGWQRLSRPGHTQSALNAGVNWSLSLDGSGSGAGFWSGRSPAGGGARDPGWFESHPLLAGAGLLALGVALDRPADRYAQDHGANPSMKALRKVGDALPTLALGLAGTQWLFERGSPAGDTAFAATAAGLGAYAGSKLLKTAISRDRPIEGLGSNSFGQSGSPRSDSSMPSNHAAIAWAVLTPYAQTYGQDWLYGLAGLTSFGRVMGREHWASDAVAGSLIGYHLGSWARTRLGNGASLSLVGRGVALSMPLP
jgi:membrane-associated phospholipid phosphatase